MDRLNWGIVSTARIGRQKLIPALQASRLNRVAAVASRTPDKAQELAHSFGIPAAYGSYEALLDDPLVDAVYIPLPNHLHLQYTLLALEAGKHVLCEKPITLDAEQAATLAQAAARHPRLKVMEAFMYRFHPQWEKVLQMLGEGLLGELMAVQTVFTFHNDNPENIRNQRETGGGALLDVGCYAVSSARLLFGAEPVRVQAAMDIDPETGIDRSTSALLEFEQGSASFTVSIRAGRLNQVVVLGSDASLRLEAAFVPPPKSPAPIELVQGRKHRVIRVPRADQYVRQVDAFARSVLQDAPVPWLLADAVHNMRALDAVRQSAHRQRPVEPGEQA